LRSPLYALDSRNFIFRTHDGQPRRNAPMLWQDIDHCSYACHASGPDF